MTDIDQKRRDAIKKLIDDYTLTHTSSPEKARQALIKEGIYTQAGNLRAEFGGSKRKSKSAA
jgi:division protein CdvB (Snf7/Vps24/ESCRT-III family)